MTSLDGGLIFERQTRLFGQSMTQTSGAASFTFIANIEEQTFQPDFDSAELTFSYGQLFRIRAFRVMIALDDANQLSVGVTSRYFDNETGEEKLSASLGQIYYFRDRSRLNPGDPVLPRHTSPLAGGVLLVAEPASGNLRASALYDTNDNTFDAASCQATYFPGRGRC